MLEKLFVALFGVGFLVAVYKIALLIQWNIKIGLDWTLFFGIILSLILFLKILRN